MGFLNGNDENSKIEKKQNTIFRILVFPMIFLLVMEMLILVMSLSACGVFSMTKENAVESLERQLDMRADSLQSEMKTSWSELMNLTSSINQITEKYIESEKLSYEELAIPSAEVGNLLNEIVPVLVTEMYSKQVSGAYLILDTEDYTGKTEGISTVLPGICIRDLDPESVPSAGYKDLLLERSPVEVVRNSSIATDNIWKPNFSDKDELMNDVLPHLLTNVYNNDQNVVRLSKYGFWTPMTYTLEDDSKQCISYIEPLVLDDGRVYGVVGIEISTDYLVKKLPYTELGGSTNSSYVLEVVNDKTKENRILAVSSFNDDEIRSLEMSIIPSNSELVSGVITPDTDSYAIARHIAVRPDADIYEKNDGSTWTWYVIGMIPKEDLYATSRNLRYMILFVIALTLLVGVLGILFVSRNITKPVRRLEQAVIESIDGRVMPRFEKTGIKEIDSFASAITELSRETEKERDFDILTELYGRRAFKRICSALMAEPQTMKKAAFFVIDLDDLKKTNDTYGHIVGDMYIKAAADSFISSLPTNSVCSRNAGDEFNILLYGFDDRSEIEEIANNLNDSVQGRIIRLSEGRSISLSASIGVAWYPDEGTDYLTLFEKADRAMYRIKKNGKGNIGFYRN